MKLAGHQLSLWERNHARRSDPDTSREAARRARSLAGQHAAQILAVLRQGGNQTCTEIAVASGLTAVQVARRMHELVDAGEVVVADGHGLTASGRPSRCFSIGRIAAEREA